MPKAWQGRANTLAQGQQDNFEKQARLLRRTSVESSHFTSQSKAFRVLFCTSLVHSCSFFSFQSFTFASNNSSLKNQLLRFMGDDVGYILVFPESGLAACHPTDAGDTVDNGIVMPLAGF